MISHAPENYDCPFCWIVAGNDSSENVYTQQADIVYRDNAVTAWVSSHQWPNNLGHVLIVPNDHYESIYTLPPPLATPIQATAQKIALAMKRLHGCDGISTRQHNEPHGNQEVWHYHLHVFPRYADDNLYLMTSERIAVDPAVRSQQAKQLRSTLAIMDSQ